MEGVTAAIVAYIFVCTLFPKYIRNRAQFYTAFGAMIIVMLIYSVGLMIGHAGFMQVVVGIGVLLELMAFIMLVLATGGMTVGQLTKEFGRTIEVIRRGETEKEIIIPKADQPPARDAAPPRQTLD